MDVIVPPAVLQELTQILSNLVLGDNDIRSNAEKTVNERLAQTPELYVLAIAQFALTAPDDHMRAFSLVLLRRLLFRAQPPPIDAPPSNDAQSHASHHHSSGSGSGSASGSGSGSANHILYDRLSEPTRLALERALLHALLAEPAASVKHKASDAITDVANASFQRGRPWPQLSDALFKAMGADAAARESAWRVVERCTVLSGEIPLEVFVRGLADTSVEVRLAAVKASASFLAASSSSAAAGNSGTATLMARALSTLPNAPHSHLTRFLNALTPLASSHPSLFAPHLQDLLRFLPALIFNKKEYDAGPTPTVSRPFPSGSSSAQGQGQGAFQFPPVQAAEEDEEDGGDDEEEDELTQIRLAALELMVSLSEAKPGMVRRVDGWVASLVRACLEGMGELVDTEAELDAWVDAEPSNDPTDTTYPHAYEQSLDRLSLALQGKPVLQLAFQYIPPMLVSHDWRLRHAGLMAIACMGEGGARVMQAELGKVVSLVTNSFADPHPRVIYAACQCIGQLCTDLEEVIQAKYHEQIFAVLIPTLEHPQPRVHAHAAAALINFCEGVERDTLIPYLDAIVARLLKLLEPQYSERDGRLRSYVQEQAVTTLAMVADVSEATFANHYASIMPLLLNVLRNANGVEHKKLRWKAMECAGLIAIAVGRDVFRPDSSTFIELLMRIQNSPLDPGDVMLNHYLIATWAKVCQALGPEFEPYLPIVMPPLLQAASAKADVNVWDDDEEDPSRQEDREGWETMSLDGQQVGIKTSIIEEKCQAFETLVIYVSTLNTKFAPYLTQSLELVLPNLKFYFHEGVREACALVLPMLLVCGKQSNTLTPQMLHAVFTQLITVIAAESDASFLASLFKCVADCVRVVGGPAQLLPEVRDGVLAATRAQLQALAEKRRVRQMRHPELVRGYNGSGGGGGGGRDEAPGGQVGASGAGDPYEDEREELLLLEELEDFALEEAGKMLKYFDANHPLLIAVSSVKELGIRQDDWESESEGSVGG